MIIQSTTHKKLIISNLYDWSGSETLHSSPVGQLIEEIIIAMNFSRVLSTPFP
jgi:hypothetical protein